MYYPHKKIGSVLYHLIYNGLWALLIFIIYEIWGWSVFFKLDVELFGGIAYLVLYPLSYHLVGFIMIKILRVWKPQNTLYSYKRYY